MAHPFSTYFLSPQGGGVKKTAQRVAPKAIFIPRQEPPNDPTRQEAFKFSTIDGDIFEKPRPAISTIIPTFTLNERRYIQIHDEIKEMLRKIGDRCCGDNSDPNVYFAGIVWKCGQ